MASGNNSTKKKNTSNKKRKPSNQTAATDKRHQEALEHEIVHEIMLIAFLAICVFLFLCNFGIIGSVGEVFSRILFGIFGLMAYVAPVLFPIALFFHYSNRESRAAKRKIISGAGCFVLTQMLCELITGRISSSDSLTFIDFYKISAQERNGGGIFAGNLANLCYHYLSFVGTFLLVIALLLICILIFTEKSILRTARNSGKYIADLSQQESLRFDKKLEKKLKRESLEDEKILRMDRKTRGVMTNTALSEHDSKPAASHDMHEITIDDSDFYAQEEAFQHIRAEEISFAAKSYKDKEQDNSDELKIEEEILSKMPEPITERTNRKPMPTNLPEANHSRQITEPTAAPRSGGIKTNNKKFVFPPISLLKEGNKKSFGDSDRDLKATALRLQQTLQTFGVKVTVTDISQGPSVTRYELQPEVGVKVSKIVGLADDIKLNLAATDIRIEAPIPGKAAVGIEVPNKENAMVSFRELIESKQYKNFTSNLAFAVGKDIGGQVVVTDIAKMPHVLIAGATGSGKSVCINTIIMSILYKAHPDDVKMIMIDPKVVELSVYNGIPHLLLPVVTDPKKAAGALHWGVAEMTERYNKFAEMNVRDLKGYNQKVEELQRKGNGDVPLKMPQILIIVDELADLMMVSPGEVEESICRLAQLARAAGIHLIIATQRPSVDVITGLIKANMPSRIAFAVSSGVDSRTILDMNGAEKLLGKGDMLFYPQGFPKPARIQGAFVSDAEVQDVVDFLKDQNVISQYSPDVEGQLKAGVGGMGLGGAGNYDSAGNQYDEYFVEAGRFIIEKDKASIGMLQRVFKIGFNRAARIMDQLCEAGVVGEEEGTKPRKVLMSPEQFEAYIEETL